MADFVGLLESAESWTPPDIRFANTSHAHTCPRTYPPRLTRPAFRRRRSDPQAPPAHANRHKMQVLHTAIFTQYWSNRKTKTAHSGRHIAASHANDNGRQVGRVRPPRSAHSTLISQPQHATRPDRRDDRWAPSTNGSSVSDAHAGVGSDPSHAPHPHPSRVRGHDMTPRAPTDACEVLPDSACPAWCPDRCPRVIPTRTTATAPITTGQAP